MSKGNRKPHYKNKYKNKIRNRLAKIEVNKICSQPTGFFTDRLKKLIYNGDINLSMTSAEVNEKLNNDGYVIEMLPTTKKDRANRTVAVRVTILKNQNVNINWSFDDDNN